MSAGRDCRQRAYKCLFQQDRALLDNSNVYLGRIIVKIKHNNPQRAIEALSINISYFNFQFYSCRYLCIFKNQAYLDKVDPICTDMRICHLHCSAFTGSEHSSRQICYFLSIYRSSMWKADTPGRRRSFPGSPKRNFMQNSLAFKTCDLRALVKVHLLSPQMWHHRLSEDYCFCYSVLFFCLKKLA